MDIPKLERIDDKFCAMHFGKLVIWFSYDTPIAFQDKDGEIRIRKNSWGKTTGNHMNYIYRMPDEDRIPGPIWEDMLKQALGE